MNVITARRVVSVIASDDLSRCTTEELKQELGRVLGITADNLVRAAKIISIVEERGEDLSHLKIGLIGYLRRIACGQVLPEVVARFVGCSSLLKRISTLPIPDQNRCLLADGLPIGVLVEGVVDSRTKPLLQMEPYEIRQVFADDHIREVEEQVAWLRSREMRRPTLAGTVEPPPYSISGNCVVVHRPVRLSRKDLVQILRSLGANE